MRLLFVQVTWSCYGECTNHRVLAVLVRAESVVIDSGYLHEEFCKFPTLALHGSIDLVIDLNGHRHQCLPVEDHEAVWSSNELFFVLFDFTALNCVADLIENGIIDEEDVAVIHFNFEVSSSIELLHQYAICDGLVDVIWDLIQLGDSSQRHRI